MRAAISDWYQSWKEGVSLLVGMALHIFLGVFGGFVLIIPVVLIGMPIHAIFPSFDPSDRVMLTLAAIFALILTPVMVQLGFQGYEGADKKKAREWREQAQKRRDEPLIHNLEAERPN